jgi:hypothetical protein
LIAVADAELLAGAVAVGVDRGLGHAKLTGDLLGAEMLVDQTQAFPLALCQKVDSGHHALEAHHDPGMLVNDALGVSSTLASVLATVNPRAACICSRPGGA